MKNTLLALLLFTSFILAQENRFNLPSQKNSMGELSFMVDDPLSDAFLYPSQIGLNIVNTAFMGIDDNPTKEDIYSVGSRFDEMQVPAGFVLGIGKLKIGLLAGYYDANVKYFTKAQNVLSELKGERYSTPIQLSVGYDFPGICIGASYYNSFKKIERFSAYPLLGTAGINYQKIMVGARYIVNSEKNISLDYSHQIIEHYALKSINTFRLDYRTKISRPFEIGLLGSIELGNFLYSVRENYSTGVGISYSRNKLIIAAELGFDHNIFCSTDNEFIDYFRIEETDAYYHNYPYTFSGDETSNNWAFKLGGKYMFTGNFEISAGMNYKYKESTISYVSGDALDNSKTDDYGITAGFHYQFNNFSINYGFVYHKVKYFNSILYSTYGEDAKMASNRHSLLITYNF